MPFNPKFRTILPLIIVSLIMAAAFAALPASADGVPKPRGGSCQNWQEKAWNDSYCAQLGGRREVRHYYVYPDGSGFILIDCETDSEVIEGGLDKRASLDSVQQALFASKLTGKGSQGRHLRQ